MTEEIFTKRREASESWDKIVELEDEVNALRHKTWDLEDIIEEALNSFKLTQDPADYPEDHWSNQAERALQ